MELAIATSVRAPDDGCVDTTFDPNAPACSDGIFGLPCGADDARVHVIGVPFDATTSYRRGTAHGPQAILAASHQVDLYDALTGRPYEQGIFMHPLDGKITALNAEASDLARPIIARGGDLAGRPELEANLARVNEISGQVNALVGARTADCFDARKLPCIVGGDHSTPFGAIAEAAARFPGLGVLHLDAHADLRAAYEGFTWSHASIFYNVLEQLPAVERVVQVGIRDLCEAERDYAAAHASRVSMLTDEEWSFAHYDGRKQLELVRATLAQLPANIWISFDIDGLDPSLCPNTGTPVPGGLTWRELTLWLRELVASGKRVVGLDLNEVSPGPEPDPDGHSWDAIVGARVLYRLIGTALAGGPVA